MKKSKKSPIFRAGDIVKIKNPEFFIRCGYPLTKEDIKREFLADKKKLAAFREFLRSIGLISSIGDNELFFMVESDQYSDILDRVCYNILKQKKFGGNERKIFTESKLKLAGKEFRVISKSVVNTGTRINGSSYKGGWDLEYEYNPPYLENQKSHVILEIEPILTNYENISNDWLKIEEINVELVKEQ